MLLIFRLFGVSSLESLAYNIKNNGYIVSLIDAKNDNVYFSVFELAENKYTLKENYSAKNINDVITVINNYKNENITFVGDGSYIYKDLLIQKFKSAYFASEKENMQTSVSIGLAGMNKFNNGLYGDSSTLLPLYLRKSQAERALDGKK